MNILLVDDEFTTLAIAQKILKEQGHQVVTAENGLEALEALRHDSFQVLISDWNMPEMDGLALCRYLHTHASASHLYFIMMTARDSQQDKLAAIDAGANEILTKPIDAAELQVRLRGAEKIIEMPTYAMVLSAMGFMAESRDTDSRGHITRMGHYARVLASEVMLSSNLKEYLPPRFPDLIEASCPAHDLGKASIPDAILLKPDSLNDEEWKVMKKHPEAGAERLDRFLEAFPQAGGEIVSMARDIALSHHERWDGSGYPRGLRGEEIPIAARVIALIDVYDALTVRRVYRTALPHSVAREIIIKSNGTHFDPQVVKAFLSVEEQFIDIHNRFND